MNSADKLTAARARLEEGVQAKIEDMYAETEELLTALLAAGVPASSIRVSNPTMECGGMRVRFFQHVWFER